MLSPSTPIVALNFGCIAGIVTEADKCSPYHELSLKTHDLCSLELKITQLKQHHQPLSGVNRYIKAENYTKAREIPARFTSLTKTYTLCFKMCTVHTHSPSASFLSDTRTSAVPQRLHIR